MSAAALLSNLLIPVSLAVFCPLTGNVFVLIRTVRGCAVGALHAGNDFDEENVDDDNNARQVPRPDLPLMP